MKETKHNELKRLSLILIIALAGTALSIGALYLVLPEGRPHDFIFKRSFIQHLTIALFWITMVTLVFKHIDHRHEESAYHRAATVLEGQTFGQQLIWSHAPDVAEQFRSPKDKRFQDTSVFQRIIRALERLHSSQSTKAMEDYFRVRSELDAAELETAYTGVRYCVWLLPTLGFVGTVMGIGTALAAFANLIPEMEDLSVLKAELPDVTEKLGTAFDTTLLALLLSVITIYYMSFVLKRQEQLLEMNDTLCFDGVCAQFQEHSNASESIIRAIHENVEQISARMNGNRGAIEQMIREEVPALVATGAGTPVQTLEASIAELLTRISELMNQSTAFQREAAEKLRAELRQLRIAQLKSINATAETVAEVREALAKISPNNELPQ